MRSFSSLLVLGILLSFGSFTTWAQTGTCGSCPSVGFCAPTFPIGAGSFENHECEDHSFLQSPGANLFGAKLSRADFSFADLSGANLLGAQLFRARLYKADLSFAELSQVDFEFAYLVSADLSDSTLFLTDLFNANLEDADLSNAILNQAALDFTRLRSANLSGASFVDCLVLDCFLNNANLTNADLENAIVAGSDFSNADLSGANLKNVSFSGSFLVDANFSGANFTGALNLGTSTGTAFYDCGTNFAGTGFDPVAAGWSNITPCGTCVQATETMRLGTPPNPNAFLPGQTSGPIVGALWDPVIDHTTFALGSALDFVAVDLGAPINALLGIGTLLCTPPPAGGIFFTTPGTPFSIAVPNDCSFIGVPACSQGGSFSPGAGIELTNALDLVLGNG